MLYLHKMGCSASVYRRNGSEWNEGEETTPATCSATGTKTYTCTHNAEHTKAEDVAIDENAHAWNEG